MQRKFNKLNFGFAFIFNFFLFLEQFVGFFMVHLCFLRKNCSLYTFAVSFLAVLVLRTPKAHCGLITGVPPSGVDKIFFLSGGSVFSTKYLF